MGQADTNLAALIGSRICHDLISPIGAINNGLELLGMSGNMPADGPELDLINESVSNASARIRFFRVAYGAASEQALSRSEVVSVLNDVMRNSRTKVAWGPLDPQTRKMVRVAFLAIQCLETAMPYGGRIEISIENGVWLAHGKTEKPNISSDLWGYLKGTSPSEPISPAHVQFALLPVISQEGGLKLETEINTGDIYIRF
jgi:histidine phosphotransferase ChpT